jgi:ParB family chromosome partitioning protein
MLRLLNLPQAIQQDLIDEKLSMGQARVLAGIKDREQQERLRERILKEALTVRQLEALLRKERAGKVTPKIKEEKDPYIQSLADELKRSLGTKVEIIRRGRKGTIVLHFYSDDELGRLLDLLT